MRDESPRYAYVTIGVVAVVALLAAWLIIGQTPSFGRDSANLRGQATTSIYPLIINADLDAPFTVGIGTVRLASVSRTDADVWIAYSPSGPEVPRTLPLGGSLPVGSFTVTLMAGDTAGKTAEFHISTSVLVCGEQDAQESLCRGASACCGGACVELPDCAAKTDGPVGSCGERPLYCCGGALGFSACGQVQPPATACVNHDDCPVIACVTAPCPSNICVSGQCTERYLTGEVGKTCVQESDCVPITCVTQPCDISTCYNGACAVFSTQPPTGGGSTQ